MPERRFDDGYWDDPFVQSLSKDGKLFYAYLWTNKHCNPAGLYQITPSTIAFETKLAEADIPQLFEKLEPKVVWFRGENLVWVKNFIKRQSISSKFLIAVARCLNSINNNGAIKALLDYNREVYTLLIPYEYPINRVLIPSIPPSPSISGSGSGSGSDKGEGGGVAALAKEIRTVLLALPHIEDHFAEHEGMKQALADLGQRKGFTAKLEMGTRHGRVDVGWLDPQGEPVAAFEVDIYEPRRKSLSKLRELDCSASFIILRTNPIPFQWEQNVLLVGLGSEVEGEQEIGVETIPPSESEIEESLSGGDREVISVWFSVRGFNMPLSDASELVTRLRTEFADLDILQESKAWAARKLSEPLKPESRSSAQIWNWMRKAREFSQERREGEQAKGRRVKGSRPTSDYRGKW